MTENGKNEAANGRDVYADIIDHPHWQSPVHPRMSMYQRAAQFAPFDALEGFMDMIREAQRTTEERIHPEEYELEMLNRKISLIASAIAGGTHPTVTVTYFEPDRLKPGGKYADITDAVKRIDAVNRKIIFMSTEGYGKINKAVCLDDIIRISGDPVDFLDDEMP